jgi:hypothetical protein
MSEYVIIGRKTYPAKLPERGAPTMRFDTRNGVVYFSRRACLLLDIHEHERIYVLQDKNDPTRFGIRKTENEDGFKLRLQRCGLRFTAAGLTRRVVPLYGKQFGVTVQIGTEEKDGAFWIIPPSAR